MSYTGKLFNEILYEVRIDDTPYYLEEDIEAMLGLHYGSVSSVLIYVERVFHDDKHAHNVLDIFCLDDAGKSYVSFNNKYEYGVNLNFITREANDLDIMYAHQIDYAVQKHFTHDSQLTILTKDQIDKTFDFDLQIKVVQSAKDYVAKNKTDLDKIINSDTPARVGILIRSHLAGIEFTPFDDPTDLIQKIEQKTRSKENNIVKPRRLLCFTPYCVPNLPHLFTVCLYEQLKPVPIRYRVVFILRLCIADLSIRQRQYPSISHNVPSLMYFY